MGFKLIIDPSTEKVFRDLNKLPEEIKRGLRRGAYLVGKSLVKEARKKINQKPKTGRTYKIYRGLNNRKLQKPRLHKASSITESPAVISGFLRKSVDFKVRGSSRLEFGAGDNNVKYARILELGGRTGRNRATKIQGRRYLRKAIRKLQNKTKKILIREIDKFIQK